jgi:hypothetical protein
MLNSRNGRFRTLNQLLLTSITALLVVPALAAEPQPPTAAVDKAINRLTDRTYTLQYRFQSGETVRYEVVHLVSVDTQVQGVRQENKSRSRSVKLWKIGEVAGDGNVDFTHSVESVNMWSSTTGRDAISYDSDKDKEVPADYRYVANMIGKPISLIKMSPTGEILDRKDQVSQIDMGTGGLTLPLPKTPVRIGDEWAEFGTVPVRTEDGQHQFIKTRQRYRLEKVETGVATISLVTQVLTPIDDGRLRSQLIQKLSQGEVRFDMDAGRVLKRTLDWNEVVVGFNGPESNMSYLARMTESLITETAAKPAAARAKQAR